MTNEAKKRELELKNQVYVYLDAKRSIPTGFDEVIVGRKLALKEKILKHYGASKKDWDDYTWHLKHAISNVEELIKFIDLTDEEIEEIKEVEKIYRWSVVPYYLSLMGDEKNSPIRLQSIPTIFEKDESGSLDPMDEEHTNPAGSITRRYPDRLIINVTNMCAMYCRHCQRRRAIGETDEHQSKDSLRESVEYIRNNPEIRDVLVTGGDAFLLSDDKLEWLLKELRSIKHVEMIRLGTRTLVSLPQRVTKKFAKMLSKYHPIYVNTQFNHPLEVTEESKKACEILVNAGIPLGNQSVLLNGINNNKYVMERLNHLLLMLRVRPYYIFHAKEVKGTKHFKTSIDDGLEIMEYLRGRTSGMAIPTYIINAPNGLGKVPILPNYYKKKNGNFIIKTWEGREINYPNNLTKPLENLL